MSAPATPTSPGSREEFVSRALEATIRIGLVAGIALWCFEIARPFILPAMWGIIIAVATRGLYVGLQSLCRGRAAPAAALYALLGLALVVAPVVTLTATLVEGVGGVASALTHGELQIPPPPPAIAEIPLLGDTISRFWTLASTNLEDALRTLEGPLKSLATWLVSAAAGAGMGVLQFVLAIAIAAVLQTQATGGKKVVDTIAVRLAGERGVPLADLAEASVRSVTRGILGVALIQALLAGAGMLVAGVPAAGLWALLCLLVAAIQLPVLLVLLPVSAYLFYESTTLTAGLFLGWSLLVGLCDNVLKPILLSRGLAVPMLVIFIGSIGGFISAGVIGLFVGSIVFCVGYTLFVAWIDPGEVETETT